MGIVSRLFDSIEGIYWYPIVALLLFIVFFALVITHTMRMRKEDADQCGEIPLLPDNEDYTQEEQSKL